MMKAGVHADSLELKLVGYYQACERQDDSALGPVGERIASKIKQSFEQAIALVVRAIVILLIIQGRNSDTID
jgi:ER membrane protein complex subunit 8/9